MRLLRTVAGPPARLVQSLDITAYRVVQEGLTNILKHSDAHSARIHVAYRTDSLDIEVADGGRPPATRGTGSGHGLAGLAERIAVFGGDFSAGPIADGGFAVRARLPREEASR